ncbi:hypothetical protein WR25_17305 isoform B [Diploscapter pachys]|uniref:Arf-GAP domain-containing protein n=1 Tax=Diploscapter pachys TaxID=2018661 RepID=A0A2A2L6Q8_9BILA|nr:hypothetical protein WR25_17305 isoform A [Diploscapter pachys]PAV81860.1 hypothetical protein WR25_17305 isoform B [Diploscapter pachys]
MAKKLDPKKEQQEWLQGILLDMLKDEENKYCADCQAKTPRWAAWNLGVFICIRCAGIHRNLGVHISKVRSVNLDSWTPEQVQSMRVMSNEKARKVYEHDLPDHFRRPTTDHQMEQFIRSKYEQKRYILKDFVYPHIDAKDLPRPNVLGQKKAPTAKFAHNASDHKPAHSPSSVAPTANRSSGIADLLDLDAPAPASALPTTSAANHNTSSLIDDFDSLAIGGQTTAPPAAVASAPSTDLDDMFGSFVSAPSSTPSVAAPIQSAPQSSNQSNGKSAAEKNDLFGLNLGEPTSTAANDGEKKSTADILSLFSTAQPAPPLIAPGGFTAFGLQAAAPSQPQPAQQTSGQMNFANFGAANGILYSLFMFYTVIPINRVGKVRSEKRRRRERGERITRRKMLKSKSLCFRL